MAVSVNVTEVLDPKTYWAYETENKDRQTKMEMIEKELKKQWPEAGEVFMVSRPEGLPVIVRSEGEFFRGQIKMVNLVRIIRDHFISPSLRFGGRNCC